MELPQTCLRHCESRLHCFRENFSLGGCTSPGSYNIFIYCTAVIMIREYFTVGGCLGVRMSNAICSGVVTPLGLELAP